MRLPKLSARLVGTTSRAHTATEQILAQRAEVGYCPHCPTATYVALPPVFALGVYTAIRTKFGLWVPRRLAAHNCAEAFGSLPSAWDWVAASLFSHAPAPLMRTPQRDVEKPRNSLQPPNILHLNPL